MKLRSISSAHLLGVIASNGRSTCVVYSARVCVCVSNYFGTVSPAGDLQLVCASRRRLSNTDETMIITFVAFLIYSNASMAKVS